MIVKKERKIAEEFSCSGQEEMRSNAQVMEHTFARSTNNESTVIGENIEFKDTKEGG